MSRRLSRPPNDLSKIAADSVSELRRAQISDAVTEKFADDNSKIYSSVAHSPNFKNKSLKTYAYFNKKDLEEIYYPIKNIENTTINKQNIVIFIMESYSKEFIGYYNEGESYTQFLDSLMQHSLVFTNAYANGLKSIEALPAITASIPTLMDNPFITSDYAQNNFESMASLLNKEGYNTAFYHGGNKGTMGFYSFSRKAGFTDYFGLEEYSNNAETPIDRIDPNPKKTMVLNIDTITKSIITDKYIRLQSTPYKQKKNRYFVNTDTTMKSNPTLISVGEKIGEYREGNIKNYICFTKYTDKGRKLIMVYGTKKINERKKKHIFKLLNSKYKASVSKATRNNPHTEKRKKKGEVGEIEVDTSKTRLSLYGAGLGSLGAA